MISTFYGNDYFLDEATYLETESKNFDLMMEACEVEALNEGTALPLIQKILAALKKFIITMKNTVIKVAAKGANNVIHALMKYSRSFKDPQNAVFAQGGTITIKAPNVNRVEKFFNELYQVSNKVHDLFKKYSDKDFFDKIDASSGDEDEDEEFIDSAYASNAEDDFDDYFTFGSKSSIAKILLGEFDDDDHMSSKEYLRDKIFRKDTETVVDTKQKFANYNKVMTKFSNLCIDKVSKIINTTEKDVDTLDRMIKSIDKGEVSNGYRENVMGLLRITKNLLSMSNTALNEVFLSNCCEVESTVNGEKSTEL